MLRPTLSASGAGAQEKGATPEEVVHKVKQAASYLAQEKEAGLATFKQKQSEYVWADTYVFVFDCAQKKNVAHPINPRLRADLQASVVEAFHEEVLRAKEPGYVPTRLDDEAMMRSA